MASRAAVLIDLTVADATPALATTASSASDAAQALTDTENSVKAASKQLKAFAAESARVNRAVRDLATATAAGDEARAIALVREAHGLDIAAKAEARYAAQTEKASKATKAAEDAEERQIKTLQKLDRAYDRLGDRVGDAGGKLASFGGMLSLPGLELAAPAVTGLGDSIELLSSPIGAATGLLAAWGVALAGSIAGSVALVAASDDLLERLDAIGRADVISGDQREQLAAARAAIEGIGDAWAEIGLILAAEVGPSIEVAADFMVGATLRMTDGIKWLADNFDLLGVALDGLTGGAFSQIKMLVDLLAKLDGTLGKVKGAGAIAANVATGGAFGQLKMVTGAAAGLGGSIQAIIDEGKAYSDAARAAREAAAAAIGAGSASSTTATQHRAAADEADRYAESVSKASASLQDLIDAGSADGLDAGALALRRFGDDLERIAALDVGPEVAGLVEAATKAATDRLFRDLAAFDARVASEVAAFAALPSAADVALNAQAAGRAATLSATAGQIQGIAGVASGNIGGALSALGPGGMLLGAAIELGPDTVQVLDDRLSEIGDAIVHLPETLAKVLATLVGFGADNAGEGIGRGVGAVLGGIAGFVVGGGPVGAAAGAALGSAAGGAIGNAAAGSRSEVAMRRNQRRARAGVTINGIVTTDVLRSLDREVKAKGGARGLRTSLATP